MSPTFQTGTDRGVSVKIPRVEVTVRVYTADPKMPGQYFQYGDDFDLVPEHLLDDLPLKRSAVVVLRTLKKTLIAAKLLAP